MYTIYKFLLRGICMEKPSKHKKNKVPKISEEQYAEYLSSLRGEETQSEQSQALQGESKPSTDLQ